MIVFRNGRPGWRTHARQHVCLLLLTWKLKANAHSYECNRNGKIGASRAESRRSRFCIGDAFGSGSHAVLSEAIQPRRVAGLDREANAMLPGLRTRSLACH